MFSAADHRSKVSGGSMPRLNCSAALALGRDQTFMFAQTQWSTNMCDRPGVGRVAGAAQEGWRCGMSRRRADTDIVVAVFVEQNIFVPTMRALGRGAVTFPE
jgi:hypothetical protein